MVFQVPCELVGGESTRGGVVLGPPTKKLQFVLHLVASSRAEWDERCNNSNILIHTISFSTTLAVAQHFSIAQFGITLMIPH